MQPLAIDPRILKTVLAPEIKVLPGRALMARVVVADGTGRGSLSIAGYLLEAELPRDVRTGDDLRLIVRDISPERVLLSIGHEQASAPQPPPGVPQLQAAPVEIPLPGGGSVEVTERETRRGAAGSPDSHRLALRYDAPALGPVDLQLTLDAGALRLGVTVAPGEPLEDARARADALRQALAAALGRAVSVTVSPRRQPLDLYA